MIPPCPSFREIARSTAHAAWGLCFSVLLSACGYESDDLSKIIRVDAFANRVVSLASKTEVATGRVVRGSYIVMFRSAALKRGFASYLSEYKHYFGLVAPDHLSDPRIKSLDYIDQVNLGARGKAVYGQDFAPPNALRLALTADQPDPVMGTLAEVRFATPEDAAVVLNEWEQSNAIWFAEPNYFSTLDGIFADYKTKYTTANIWWHKSIKLYEAFDAMEQRQVPPHPADDALFSPVVAILDSGLDIDHPDIVGHLWVNTAVGQSGCPGDVNGCDVTKTNKGVFGDGVVYPFAYNTQTKSCPEDADGMKNCQHGTHVAGIIAAEVNAGYGGVCPLCKVMPVKIIGLSEDGSNKGGAQTKWQLAGLKYITKFVHNQKSLVRVVNSSFGDYARSRAATILISVLAQSPNEILVIGAAGNEDSMQRLYPAANEKAIAVAALDPSLRKATYSNYGPWVDVAAPGGIGAGKTSDEQMIYSLKPGGGGTYKVGTSMACPVVSGVAALTLTIDPNRSFDQLRESIVYGADPTIYNPDVGNGYNNRYYYVKPEGDKVRRPLLGSGVVDARCAVANCRQAAGYVPAKISRVDNNCGVVGGAAAPGLAFLCLHLACGLGLVVARRQRLRAIRAS